MKKGFTLLELLSVIIILAVITLIAVPVISGITTKVRLNALKSSAYGLLEASNLYYSQYANTKSVRFNINDNNVTSNDTTQLLTYNGEVKEGTVIINKKGETTLCITDGKNSVYKNYRDQKVIEVANKRCTIPSSTYVVYLDNEATLSELSNEELTNELNEVKQRLQELENNKANQSDLETVSTVASNAATLNSVYPVGSIYVSTNSTSPATLFGGTWERIQDTFLLAAGSTYAAGNTGGSATNSHTHSVTASGSVGSTTLTTAQIPSHYHSVNQISNAYTTTGGRSSMRIGTWDGNNSSYMTLDTSVMYSNSYNGSQVYYTDPGHDHTVIVPAHNTNSTGSTGSHNHTFTGTAVTSGGASDTNNMPPYLSVYVWKRTA